ncbi:hypothetical protein HK102_004431 [Quaeritorhiza haematococci]|nr:hypothetical protein HK102_004431 [Quaeritorhiza haematococci]
MTAHTSSSSPLSSSSSTGRKRKQPNLHTFSLCEDMLETVLAQDDNPVLLQEFRQIKSDFDKTQLQVDAYDRAATQLARAKQHYATLVHEVESFMNKLRDEEMDLEAKTLGASRMEEPMRTIRTEMLNKMLEVLDGALTKGDDMYFAYESTETLLQMCENRCKDHASAVKPTLEAATAAKKAFFRTLSARIRDDQKRQRRDDEPRPSRIPPYPEDVCTLCLEAFAGQELAFLNCECSHPACLPCIKELVARRQNGVSVCPSCRNNFTEILSGFPSRLKVNRGFVQLAVDNLRDVELFLDVKSLFDKEDPGVTVKIVPAGLSIGEGVTCEGVTNWENMSSGEGMATWKDHWLLVEEKVDLWREEMGVVVPPDDGVIVVGP